MTNLQLVNYSCINDILKRRLIIVEIFLPQVSTIFSKRKIIVEIFLPQVGEEDSLWRLKLVRGKEGQTSIRDIIERF